MTQAQEFDIQAIRARDPQYARALEEHPIHYAVQQKKRPSPARCFVVVGDPPEGVARDGIASGTVVRIDAPWRESLTIPNGNGAEPFKLDPTDTTADAVDPPRSMDTLLRECVGVVPEDSPHSERWRAEWQAWLRSYLPGAPSDVFEEFSGRRAVFLAALLDRGVNGFRIPLESGRADIGEPSELPARSYWTGQDAAKLVEAARVREEAERAAKAKADAVRLEAERPRSCAEIGASIVAVRRDGPDANALEPWKGATLLWATETENYYGFKTLLGLPLPPYKGESLRVVDPASPVPSHCTAIPEASISALAWARWVSTRHAPDPLALGPIEQWSTEGEPRAKELAVVFAAIFLNPRLAHLWSHCIEVLVRALRIYPPQVEGIIRYAMRAEELKRNPPFKIPSQFAERERANQGKDYAQPETATREIARIDPLASVPTDPEIAGLIVAAAKGGSVSIGCLLAAPPTFPSTPKPSIKKAGK